MDAISLLVDRLERGRNWTKSLLEDISEKDWFKAPGPNLGHVAWQVGHLAASQVALIHVRCFDKTFAEVAPANYAKIFGRGSIPTADPAAYPPIPEIRGFFDRIQREAIAVISAMPPAALDEPTPGEAHPMFANKGGAIAMAAMHESFHAGQIALIRRLWGRAPLR